MGWGVGDLTQARKRFYTRIFSTAYRPTPGPTQFPIQLISETLFPGVKRRGREADNSPPTSAEFNNDGAILTFPIYLCGIVINCLNIVSDVRMCRTTEEWYCDVKELNINFDAEPKEIHNLLNVFRDKFQTRQYKKKTLLCLNGRLIRRLARRLHPLQLQILQ
jgi:hypothetical protein